MDNNSCLIYCHCGAGLFSEKDLGDLEKVLKNLRIDVFELQDLCAVSVNEKEFLNSIGKNYNNKIIVACFPRAIKNMLEQNDIDFGNYEVLNLRDSTVVQVQNKLKNQFQLSSGNANYQIKKSELTVPAWYPVIDRSLCTLCGQCSRFCLFGVYKFNKKSLRVVDPLACKNNCPACGRTCPANAIIFMRLPENSALSGAEQIDTPVRAEDKDGFLELLNKRNRNRKDILKDGLMIRAQEERKNALEELKNEQKKKS